VALSTLILLPAIGWLFLRPLREPVVAELVAQH